MKNATKKISNEKGQIFSIDFLLSVVLVMLALALIFQYMELKAYSEKDVEMFEDVKEKALLASDLLTGSSELNCKLDGGNIALPNCIGNEKINAGKIGITEKFGCYVKGVKVEGCETDESAGAKVFFAVERKVVEGQDVETEIWKCMKGAECGLHEKDLLVKVWGK